jgi:hypothetical protein
LVINIFGRFVENGATDDDGGFGEQSVPDSSVGV